MKTLSLCVVLLSMSLFLLINQQNKAKASGLFLQEQGVVQPDESEGTVLFPDSLYDSYTSKRSEFSSVYIGLQREAYNSITLANAEVNSPIRVERLESVTQSFLERNSQLIAQDSGEALFTQASRAAVSIRVGNAVGLGIVVSADGLILTSGHLAGNSRTVIVRLADGREIEGRIVADDPSDLNLAVVQIQPQGNLPYLRLQSGSVQIGQTGYIIEPDVNETSSGSLISTIVSRIDRNEGLIQVDGYLQDTTTIAPLLSTQGELIGVVSQQSTEELASASRLVFAVSPERIQNLLASVANSQTATSASAQDSCSSGSIQNNVAQIVESPTALDGIIACGSAAVPFILEALPIRPDGHWEFEEREILLMTALGEMGSDASSAERALLQMLGTNSIAQFGTVSGAYLFNYNESSEKLILQIMKEIGGLSLLRRIAQDSSLNDGFRYLVAMQLIEEDENAATTALRSILENSNSEDGLRYSAIERLVELDQIEDEDAAILIEDIVQNIYANPDNGREYGAGICLTPYMLATLRDINSDVANRLEQQIGTSTFCGFLPASALRTSASERLQSSRPAICRIPTFRAVFSSRCR